MQKHNYAGPEVVRLSRRNRDLSREVDELLTVLIVVTVLLFVMVAVALHAAGWI